VLNSPIAVSVIYTILFSASKQVGAFLFGLSFLIASAVVPNDSVRKSLLISCIGMVILFSSVEIRPLQYRVLPPYGLVTEAFIPLGAFMLLVGIFISAVNVSQDRELRREFRKSAIAQLNLLRTSGIAQMEKELLKNFKLIEKRYPNVESTQDYSEDNVKEIVREVLQEIKRKDLENVKR
jgi:predicted neutral ceramidase superfamily lipid hydrolase